MTADTPRCGKPMRDWLYETGRTCKRPAGHKPPCRSLSGLVRQEASRQRKRREVGSMKYDRPELNGAFGQLRLEEAQQMLITAQRNPGTAVVTERRDKAGRIGVTFRDGDWWVTREK
jgi:hypothetical protein